MYLTRSKMLYISYCISHSWDWSLHTWNWGSEQSALLKVTQPLQRWTGVWCGHCGFRAALWGTLTAVLSLLLLFWEEKQTLVSLSEGQDLLLETAPPQSDSLKHSANSVALHHGTPCACTQNGEISASVLRKWEMWPRWEGIRHWIWNKVPPISKRPRAAGGEACRVWGWEGKPMTGLERAQLSLLTHTPLLLWPRERFCYNIHHHKVHLKQ